MAKRLLVLLVILGVVFMGCPTDDNEKKDPPIEYDVEYDIVVVGAGIAGYSAVTAAKSANADGKGYSASDEIKWNDLTILHIDKRGEGLYGGVTRTAGGGWNGEVTFPISRTFSEFRDRWQSVQMGGNAAQTNTIHQTPANLSHIPANAKYPIYGKLYWMYRQGENNLAYQRRRGLPPSGNGGIILGDLETYRENNPDVPKVELNKKAVKILTEKNEVTGVRYEDLDTGAFFNVKAKKVILATGGFSNLTAAEQISLELARGEYVPGGAEYFNNSVRVEAYGDGHIMGRAIGAALYPDSYAASDGRATISYFVRDIPTYGSTLGGLARAQQILVGTGDGKRFRPESSVTNNPGNYYMVSRKMGPYWYIFDSSNKGEMSGTVNIIDALEAAITAGTTDAKIALEVKKGAELGDLADAMGMGATAKASFLAEVAAYNAAVKVWLDAVEDNGGFGGLVVEDIWVDPLKTFIPPGFETAAGWEKTPGTNGANLRTFTEGPYYAIQLHPQGYDSTGGLVTDGYGRVLKKQPVVTRAPMEQLEGDGLWADNTADIIPNLYAVGAVSNRFMLSHSYAGGTSLASYATFGTITGRHAGEVLLGFRDPFGKGPDDALNDPLLDP